MPPTSGGALSQTPVLLVLTPDFFNSKELMAETARLLRSTDPAAFVPLYSTALPFEEYISMCGATADAQILESLGLLDLMYLYDKEA